MLAVAGLVATGLVRFLGGGHAPSAAVAAPEHRSVKMAVAPPRAASPVRAAPATTAEAPQAPLPRSLEGTEVDGGLDVDEDGHLVLGPRVIALFDYFYSAAGEESDAAIRARIGAYARQHTTEPALGETLVLLDKYAAYRDAARALRGPESASPAERLAAVHELRRAHFGDAAEALFGAEERSAAAAIARKAVVDDKTLSPDERADRLAEVDERLPAAERQARAQATSVAQFRDDEAALRAAGADDAEIHRFRAGTLGDEAAARLDTLDRERAAWKERLETFRRDLTGKCGAVPDSACETALLESSFDEHERIRVRAILSMPAD